MVLLVMDLDAFMSYPWGRVAFKILIQSVKDKDLTKSYTIDGFVEVLQLCVYSALPYFASIYREPINKATPPILAYHGSRCRKYVKEAMLKQIRINDCVTNDLAEIFPRWDNDEEDKAVDNIVKAKFGEFGGGAWKWKKTDWVAYGLKISNSVKSEATMKSKRKIYSNEESQERHRPPSSSVDEVRASLVEIMLTLEMKEGFANCDNKWKLITEKVEAIEQRMKEARTDEQVKSNKITELVGQKEEYPCIVSSSPLKIRSKMTVKTKGRKPRK